MENSISLVSSKLQTAHKTRYTLQCTHQDLKQRLHEVTATLADILCPRKNTRALPPPATSQLLITPRPVQAAIQPSPAILPLTSPLQPPPPAPLPLTTPAQFTLQTPAAAPASLPPRVHGYFTRRSRHVMTFEDYRHYETISVDAVAAADPFTSFEDPATAIPQAAARYMAQKAADVQQDPAQICWWYQAPHAVTPGGLSLSFSVCTASPECLASMFLYFFMHALEGCFLLEAKSILEGAATPCAPPPAAAAPVRHTPALQLPSLARCATCFRSRRLPCCIQARAMG